MSGAHVYRFYLIVVLVSVFYVAYGFDSKAFDDTNLFKINWLSTYDVEDMMGQLMKAEPHTITSANNEKYQCFIPEIMEQNTPQEEEYLGPNPMEYLSHLFELNTCSYRLESYWTYELCHGRYVQQYHEERDGKKVKEQKYVLGKIEPTQLRKLTEYYSTLAENPNRKQEIPVKKIDGVSMPYLEMEMTDGTLCDLNGKPRTIKVLYVCFQHGKQEIYSIKETSTCEYETIVLTPLLCRHPDFKPLDSGENKINCMPLFDAPEVPTALMEMQLESLNLRLKLERVQEPVKPQKVSAVFVVDEDGEDGEPQVRVEIHPVDSHGRQFILEDSLNSINDKSGTAKSLHGENIVESILSGRNCLNGGNGWWKYEFCYGRSVTQYHIESGGAKTIVNLGVFNKKKHMEWIDTHPHKKPKPIGQRKQLSHFYSEGSICDKTGKERQTEVKLKCVTYPNGGSPSSVSLYLLEPKTCEYILGVESPLICDILALADNQYGIVDDFLSDMMLVNLEKQKTNFPVEDTDERIANEDE